MESKWVKMVGFCRVWEVAGKTWNGLRGSLLTRERVGWPRVEWRNGMGSKGAKMVEFWSRRRPWPEPGWPDFREEDVQCVFFFLKLVKTGP